MVRHEKNYVLDSNEESARLDRQARMKAFDFKPELAFLPIRAGQRILDAGCGSGIVTAYLARLAPGVTVTGWDFSAERIEVARAKYGADPNIHFAPKNLLDPGLTAEDERFDVIVCRYVLRHFKTADGQKVMKNLYDALKPGGTLCCIDVDGVLGETFPASAFLKKSLTRLREAKAVDFQVARKMPALLLAQGFEDVAWHGLICEFKGEELAQEIENLQQSVRNAEAFAKKLLGGAAPLARFQKEYFAALRQPGHVHCYTRVVATGTKPRVKPTLVSSKG